MSEQYKRPPKKAMELLWMPQWGLSPDLCEKRNAAILEVACRLSDKVVNELEDKADSFFGLFQISGFLLAYIPFPSLLGGPKMRKRALRLVSWDDARRSYI
jgi:hypothetical protein